MAKDIRKPRLIDGWRLGENESWLTDMADRGLHLKSLGIIFAHFTKGAPQKNRYRLDVSFPEQTAVSQEMFRDSGWEFVCRTGMINVYRSPESANLPELHTDASEQSFTLRKLSGKLKATALISAVGALLIIYSQITIFLLQDTPVIAFVAGETTNSIILCLLYLFLIVYNLQPVISIRKLMRSMREGRAVNHRARWAGRRRLEAVKYLIILPFLLVIISGTAVRVALARSAETLPLKSDNPAILRLADIERNPALERKTVWVTADDVDWGNRVQRGWSLLAPEQYYIEENGAVSGQLWPDSSAAYSPSLEFRYYELTFPRLADALLRDLAGSSALRNDFNNAEFPTTEHSVPGFDSFSTREFGFFREVFARKANVVIYVKYYGERDMETVADIVTNFIADIPNKKKIFFP